MTSASRSTQRVSGWGRVRPVSADVRSVRSAEEAAALVRASPAGGVLARGMGRSYGDAAQVDQGCLLHVDPTGVPPELDTATGLVRVSAGTTLENLMRVSVPHGWTVPVLPGTRFVSVGGAIAADVHGKNHHVDGSFGQWVRELTLVDGNGDVRELSPTTDASAFWATLGGMGLTGIVTAAKIALRPITSTTIAVRTRKFTELDSALDVMSESTHRYHVAWVDAAPGRNFGRSVLDEGDDDTAAQPLHYAPRLPVPAPRMPTNLVRRGVIKGFNELWWRRFPLDKRAVVPLGRFFHPLDGVGSWPRLYGPGGFVQWQIAVPLDAGVHLEAWLRALTCVGAVPSLVVLKRFGPASPGPLSFPFPGWTLAVDVPAGHPALLRTLHELDEQVADAGGRIYLAKDACAEAATVARMYPRLDEWRDTRASLDPKRRFSSDLARRLELV